MSRTPNIEGRSTTELCTAAREVLLWNDDDILMSRRMDIVEALRKQEVPHSNRRTPCPSPSSSQPKPLVTDHHPSSRVPPAHQATNRPPAVQEKKRVDSTKNRPTDSAEQLWSLLQARVTDQQKFCKFQAEVQRDQPHHVGGADCHEPLNQFHKLVDGKISQLYSDVNSLRCALGERIDKIASVVAFLESKTAEFDRLEGSAETDAGVAAELRPSITQLKSRLDKYRETVKSSKMQG